MDTTKTIINEYLLKMLEAVEKGATFVANEIPLVLTEYVMYKAVYFWILTSLGIAGLIKGGLWFKKGVKLDHEGYTASGLIATLIGAITFFVFVFDAIQATFFPRIFLLEQAMDLVNGCSNCH
jgi:hypothetical protein